jgi:hypothetical protein
MVDEWQIYDLSYNLWFILERFLLTRYMWKLLVFHDIFIELARTCIMHTTDRHVQKPYRTTEVGESEITGTEGDAWGVACGRTGAPVSSRSGRRGPAPGEGSGRRPLGLGGGAGNRGSRWNWVAGVDEVGDPVSSEAGLPAGSRPERRRVRVTCSRTGAPIYCRRSGRRGPATGEGPGHRRRGLGGGAGNRGAEEIGWPASRRWCAGEQRAERSGGGG